MMQPSNNPNYRRRWIISAVMVISLFAMIGSIQAYRNANSTISIPLPLLSTLRPEAIAIKNFNLIDQHGKSFTVNNLKGKWSFVFFGYTSCPDVCPTTLTEMNGAASLLAQQMPDQEFQFIMVTVDPERDNVQHLKDYVSYFSPQFIGLTGGQIQIDALAKQLNIVAMREPSTKDNEYDFKHTSSVMLIDPKARIYASFAPNHNAKRITEQFTQLHLYYQKTS